MSLTARFLKGAGPLALGGLLLTGAAAVADEPSLPAQLVGLGAQALQQGRTTDAAAFYRKALALDPLNAEARKALSNSALVRVAFQQLDSFPGSPTPPAEAGQAPPPPPPEPAPDVEEPATSGPPAATLEHA